PERATSPFGEQRVPVGVPAACPRRRRASRNHEGGARNRPACVLLTSAGMSVTLRDPGVGDVVFVASHRASAADREAAMPGAAASWMWLRFARGLDLRTLARLLVLALAAPARDLERSALEERVRDALERGRLLAVRKRRRRVVLHVDCVTDDVLGPREPT